MTKASLAIYSIVILFFTLSSAYSIKANLQNPTSSILIVEIYYDTYLPYEPEEYIKIYNPTENNIDISNWELTDLEGNFVFPNCTILKSKESIYVTRNSSAFNSELGFTANFEVNNKFQLANSGDDVILKDARGNVIDAIIYGNSNYNGEGWVGKPARAVSEGTILKRKISEVSGLYLDSDSASDWDSPRIYKVGQSNFEYKTFQLNTTVVAFVSPDSSFQVVKEELEKAKESVYLSLYQFTNYQLAKYLINASERNVDIKILLEGSPVGWNFSNVDEQEYYEGINAYREAYLEKYICSMLLEKGCEIRFMVSDSERNIPTRYNYLHSKYAVIDNHILIISSENWKPTGIPMDNTYGDRGWGVVIKSSQVARYFADVFFEDFNLSKNDIIQMNLNDERYLPPNWFVVSEEGRPTTHYKPKFGVKITNSSFNISPVLSPDSSLLENSSVLGLINSAKKYIYIELLSCKLNWSSYPNLYLESVIDAARRGCEVKILLDGKYVSNEINKQDNLDTVAYVNGIARRENLNLEAKALVFEKNYLAKIHNKGIVVDGEKVLISSINWNYNSVAKNREAGVIIENRDTAKYFEDVFIFDWTIEHNNDNDSNYNEKISLPYSITIILIVIITLSVIRDLKK